MIKVTLKDGSVKEFEAGVSVLDVAKGISEGLARNACCGIVDGKVTDTKELAVLAATPSREQLLTMFAAGLMEHVKNVAICLDLHSQNLEG